MKMIPLACCCLTMLFLVACNDTTNAIPGMPFAYNDFGPEQVAAPLLGPKGNGTQVIARFGSTHTTPPSSGPDVRYVNVEQAMNFLRRAARALPRTEENVPVHQRLSATYARMFQQYSTKRNSMVSAPSSSYGRGGMNRALMMPPMPPSI